MKIIRIIRSKLRDKNKLKKEKWYMDRLNACNSCPFNSKNNKNRDKSNLGVCKCTIKKEIR